MATMTQAQYEKICAKIPKIDDISDWIACRATPTELSEYFAAINYENANPMPRKIPKDKISKSDLTKKFTSKFSNSASSLFKDKETEKKFKALAKAEYQKKQKVDPFYNMTIEDDCIPEDSMADVRYKVSSDKFDIDVNDHTFRISLKTLCTEVGYSTSEGGAGPWPSVERIEQGEKNLGSTCPKISMISSETGKDATFFLTSSTEGYLIFKPSKGTVMNKTQLRGWIIEVDRNG